MRKSVFTLAVLVLTTSACAGIQTSQDFIPGTDFSGLRTFDWMPDPPAGQGPQVDALVDRRFDNALEEVLEGKGFQRVTSGQPDFRVGYHLALDEEVDYQQLNSYWGGRWGYGRMYGPTVRVTTVEERRYTTGTLIIDIFDVDAQELVWRGSGESRVSDDVNTPQERQERVTQAVRLVLERFPPDA